MASLDEQIVAGFPSPHRDEPANLRRDIADELADHLACALAREMKRTPDEAAARAAALERFGNPARLARRLWLDWMKEAIMRDRVLMAGMILLALATLAMAAFGWMLFKDSRETNRAMLAALQKMSAAKEPTKEPGKEIPSDLGTAAIRVVADTPGKEPVAGAGVDIMGDPFGEKDKDNNGNRWLRQKTDGNGEVHFGPVRPGEYKMYVYSASGLKFGKQLFVFGGREVQETVLAPSLPKATVTARTEVPEDLAALDLGFRAEFGASVVASDKESWTIQVTLPFGPDGQPVTPEENKPLPCLSFSLKRLLVDLPADLTKVKASADGQGGSDLRRTIEGVPTAAEAKTFETKADSPNEWRIALPANLVEQVRLSAADSKFLLETAVLDPALASVLPPGRIVRLSPLDKAVSVRQEPTAPSPRPGPAAALGVTPKPQAGSGRLQLDSLRVSNLANSFKSLMAWPAPPANDVLGSAGRRCFLALYAEEAITPKETGDLPREIDVWELTADWQETSVTLATLPTTRPEPVSKADYAAGKGWRLFDVTALVKAEAESQRKCPGVLIRFRDDVSFVGVDAELRRMEYVFDGRLASINTQRTVSVQATGYPFPFSAEGYFRPLLVIVDPDEPGAQAAEPHSAVPAGTAPATAAIPAAASEADLTREQRLEQRKAEVNALREQRIAEMAAQLGGAGQAK